jgi:hypothetical protein
MKLFLIKRLIIFLLINCIRHIIIELEKLYRIFLIFIRIFLSNQSVKVNFREIVIYDKITFFQITPQMLS